MSIALYMIVMAGVTYLVRMVPFVAFRKKISSPFVKSFLYIVVRVSAVSVYNNTDSSATMDVRNYKSVLSCYLFETSDRKLLTDNSDLFIKSFLYSL